MTAIAGEGGWKVQVRICPIDRPAEDRTVAVQAISAKAAIDLALDWWRNPRNEILGVTRIADICLRQVPGVEADMVTGHNCSRPDSNVWCEEMEDGKLFLRDGEYQPSRVNFCPFCGAKAPKQIVEGADGD